MEITKEGVSIYFLKKIICINIYIFFSMGFEQNLYIVFLKEKRWNMVRWYGWANGQPPSKQCKDGEPHPQSGFVRTKHRDRRANYSHKPVHFYFYFLFFFVFFNFLLFFLSFYHFQEKCILCYLIFSILLIWNNKFLNRTLILLYKGVFERNTEIRK